MPQVGQGLCSEFFCQDGARRHVFQVKQVGGLEGLVGSDNQVFFAMEVFSQFRVEHQAPEDVPFARRVVGDAVYDQSVIVFRRGWRAILFARDYYVEV